MGVLRSIHIEQSIAHNVYSLVIYTGVEPLRATHDIQVAAGAVEPAAAKDLPSTSPLYLCTRVNFASSAEDKVPKNIHSRSVRGIDLARPRAHSCFLVDRGTGQEFDTPGRGGCSRGYHTVLLGWGTLTFGVSR